MRHVRVSRRVGGLLVWIGLLLAALYVGTQWHCLGWTWVSAGRAKVVMIADGKLVVGTSTTVWPDGSSWWGALQGKLPAGPVLSPLGSMRIQWGSFKALSQGVSTETVRSFHPIPPSVVCVGIGLYILVRTRRGRDVCRQCGYSLLGNATGVCPECGTKTQAVAGNNPA